MADGTIFDQTLETALTRDDRLLVQRTSAATASKATTVGDIALLVPIVPGGRLTLTSGSPVDSSDVTGATSIYYTPYLHNLITLWDGSQWQTIEFTEYTLALGTLTSGKPYDVFAYLNSGALALEVLVWTDDDTRATAVTRQDGRLCKSGDKTRLLLGTFYTTSTTETEDSEEFRYLSNAYNRVEKRGYKLYGSTHSYSSTTERNWNNVTSSGHYLLECLPDANAINLGGYGYQEYGYIGIRLNGTRISEWFGGNDTNYRRVFMGIPYTLPAGRNSVIACQIGYSGGNNFTNVKTWSDHRC